MSEIDPLQPGGAARPVERRGAESAQHPAPGAVLGLDAKLAFVIEVVKGSEPQARLEAFDVLGMNEAEPGLAFARTFIQRVAQHAVVALHHLVGAGPRIQFPIRRLCRPEGHVQAPLVLDEHPLRLALIGDVLHRSLRQEIVAGFVVDVFRHFEEGPDVAIRPDDPVFQRVAGVERGKCLRHPFSIHGINETVDVLAVRNRKFGGRYAEDRRRGIRVLDVATLPIKLLRDSVATSNGRSWRFVRCGCARPLLRPREVPKHCARLQACDCLAEEGSRAARR